MSNYDDLGAFSEYCDGPVCGASAAGTRRLSIKIAIVLIKFATLLKFVALLYTFLIRGGATGNFLVVT